jgi:hypothetical protein
LEFDDREVADRFSAAVVKAVDHHITQCIKVVRP